MPPEDAAPVISPTDPVGALRVPAFRRYLAGALLETMGGPIRTAAVRWDLYERTGSTLTLGYVGFVLALPAANWNPVSLPTGSGPSQPSRSAEG